jgi:hypothetical protein
MIKNSSVYVIMSMFNNKFFPDNIINYINEKENWENLNLTGEKPILNSKIIKFSTNNKTNFLDFINNIPYRTDGIVLELYEETNSIKEMYYMTSMNSTWGILFHTSQDKNEHGYSLKVLKSQLKETLESKTLEECKNKIESILSIIKKIEIIKENTKKEK